jgi:hypothetical protein
MQLRASLDSRAPSLHPTRTQASSVRSPTSAQLVQKLRRWSETSGFSRFPGTGQCFVQRPPFLVTQIVTLIVRNKVDGGALGQRSGLVEHEPALFDASTEGIHVATVRFFP